MKVPFRLWLKLPDGTEHQVTSISVHRDGRVGRLSTFADKPFGPYYTIEGDELDQCMLVTEWPEPMLADEGRQAAATPGQALPAPGGNPADGSSPSRPTRENSFIAFVESQAKQAREGWVTHGYGGLMEEVVADMLPKLIRLTRALQEEREQLMKKEVPPTYDRDALAKIAIDATGINPRTDDPKLLERYGKVVDAVLSAAWPEVAAEYQWMLRAAHQAGDDLKEMTESNMQELERANEAERANGTLVEEILRIEERATDIRTKLMDACVFGEEQAERARKAEEERDRYERALKELWEHPEFNRGLFRRVADTLGIERKEPQS